MDNILKATELTGVIGRVEMEKMNNSPEWTAYRNLYNQTSDLRILDFPIQIDFELNSSCNLRCPMCVSSIENRSHAKHIDIKFFKSVMEYAVARGTKALKLNHVNEPLVRSDFFDFVKCAEDVGVLDIYFSTNGMLLTNKVIESILNSKISRVQISIDAVNETIYNKVRPGGNYNRVVKNVHKLLEKRKGDSPLVRVNFVKTEINEHQQESFIKMWEPLVDMVGVQEFVQPPNSGMISSTSTDKLETEFKCSFPFKQLVISADKQVFPCCTFWGREMSLGKIESPDDLYRFWHSPLMNHLRNIHLNGEFYRMYQCRKCSGK